MKDFFSFEKPNRPLMFLPLITFLQQGGARSKINIQKQKVLTMKFKKQVKKDYTESKKHLFIHSEGVRLRIQCFNLYFNSGF